MQKSVQRLWIYDPTQFRKAQNVRLVAGPCYSKFITSHRHSGFSILFYTILHKFRKFIHSIHMCNKNNLIIKIQAKGN